MVQPSQPIDPTVTNRRPDKNLSFVFSKVAATKKIKGFAVLSHSLTVPHRDVLRILSTNWPTSFSRHWSMLVIII
jgi:hypothetical protein